MKRYPILALALAATAAPMANAKPAGHPPPRVTADSDRALTQRAMAYLSGLKSAEARFSQTDPRGAVTTGRFSLQRPGRARFAYDPPADLTVVADGVNVNVADAKLKTFDSYPLKQTPLALLLGVKVSLNGAVKVDAVSRTDAGFSVTLRQTKSATEGSLTLDFKASPMSLAGWAVVDGTGQRTSVKLSGLRTGISLQPSLFVLHDPRPRTVKP